MLPFALQFPSIFTFRCKSSILSDKLLEHAYKQPISPIVWGEIVLGIYAMLTMIILVPLIGWGIAPWMIIYMSGYFYIAGLNLIQHGARRKIRGHVSAAAD